MVGHGLHGERSAERNGTLRLEVAVRRERIGVVEPLAAVGELDERRVVAACGEVLPDRGGRIVDAEAGVPFAVEAEDEAVRHVRVGRQRPGRRRPLPLDAYLVAGGDEAGELAVVRDGGAVGGERVVPRCERVARADVGRAADRGERRGAEGVAVAVNHVAPARLRALRALDGRGDHGVGDEDGRDRALGDRDVVEARLVERTVPRELVMREGLVVDAHGVDRAGEVTVAGAAVVLVRRAAADEDVGADVAGLRGRDEGGLRAVEERRLRTGTEQRRVLAVPAGQILVQVRGEELRAEALVALVVEDAQLVVAAARARAVVADQVGPRLGVLHVPRCRVARDLHREVACDRRAPVRLPVAVRREDEALGAPRAIVARGGGDVGACVVAARREVLPRRRGRIVRGVGASVADAVVVQDEVLLDVVRGLPRAKRGDGGKRRERDERGHEGQGETGCFHFVSLSFGGFVRNRVRAHPFGRVPSYHAPPPQESTVRLQSEERIG